MLVLLKFKYKDLRVEKKNYNESCFRKLLYVDRDLSIIYV